MSFAKAKRFLEIIPIGPSPTEYNVNVASKLPGVAIPKSERFIEPKSPCVTSENGGSIKSAPCFRTPNLPKKKKFVFPSPATPAAKAQEDEVVVEGEIRDEELQAKIVECQNKDQFIQDLYEQIDDLKERLGHFKTEKEALNTETMALQKLNAELEENHQSSIKTLEENHDLRVQELQEGIITANEQIISIKEQYALIKAEKKADLEKLRGNLSSFEESHKNMCDTFNKELESKEVLLQNKETELWNLEQQLINHQTRHADEIDKLTKEHQAEVQDIEYEMLKSITNMQHNLEKEQRNSEKKLAEIETQLQRQLQDYKQKYECEKLMIVHENDSKIKQLEENNKESILLVEMQLHEKIQDAETSWAKKLNHQRTESLAIMEEYKEISLYNIIQGELEKNKAVEDLNVKVDEVLTLSAEMNTLKDNIKSSNEDLEELRAKFNKTNQENIQNRETLELKDKELEQVSQQLAVDMKTSSITIRISHDTIEVLKKRLLNSDRDVIQLKTELEACESDKLKLEERCSTLQEELTKKQSLLNDFEEEVTTRIKQVNNTFTEKIENYKSTVNESIDAYIAKIEQQQELLVSLKEQLEKQEGINAIALQLNDKYQEDNSQLETAITEHVNKISNLEFTKKKLETTVESLQKEKDGLKNAMDEEEVENLRRQLFQVQEKSDTYYNYLEYYKTKAAEYQEELVEVADIRKKYIEKSGCYDQLLQKHDELRNKVLEQNALIDPFRKQLEEYKRENSELLNQVDETENQAKDLALKCAKLLGHQNHKQKIQHLIDLKNKNDELQQGLKESKIKDKSQSKLIEKLREELDSLKKNKKNKMNVADKENISSPNRTLNNSRGLEGSPGPLRERN